MRAGVIIPDAGASIDGAAAVGALDAAAGPERRFVRCLRLWLVAPERRFEAEAALTEGLPVAVAARAAERFDGYLAAVADAATRKLWRHHPGCPCLGRDEAMLAGAMREAAAGARERAWAILSPAIRAAALFEVAERAGLLGRALAAAADPAPRRAGGLLH
jgi:hypothetical protein